MLKQKYHGERLNNSGWPFESLRVIFDAKSF